MLSDDSNSSSISNHETDGTEFRLILHNNPSRLKKEISFRLIKSTLPFLFLYLIVPFSY